MDVITVTNYVEERVPLVLQLGAIVEELTVTKARVRLAQKVTNNNSNGTVHSGALMGLADATATALCLMAFGHKLTFFAKSAELKFRRQVQGDVIAKAQLTPADAQRILDGVTVDGKLDAVVAVELVDSSGDQVATANLTLSMRRA